jgi:hypothetical protein
LLNGVPDRCATIAPPILLARIWKALFWNALRWKAVEKAMSMRYSVAVRVAQMPSNVSIGVERYRREKQEYIARRKMNAHAWGRFYA